MNKLKYFKEERHEFYKTLLRKVCRDPKCDYGICVAISQLSFPFNSSIKDFPEIYNQRPPYKKYCGPSRLYWFPLTYKGWEKRIKIIEKAIEMTKS